MATADQIQNSFSGYPRTLMWSDFPVRATSPDPPHAAQTVSSFSMSHGSAALGTDGWYRLTNVRVRVTLNTGAMWQARDWFDSARNQDQIDLLEHEQGHFDIGKLCLKEFLTLYHNTTFHKKDMDATMKNIFYTTMHKYDELGVQYDRETDHSQQKEAQQHWNTFFAKYIEQ